MILLLRSAEQPNSMACENVGPHPLGGGTEGMCPHHEQPKDDKREALAIELAQWRGHGQREKTYDEADRILALLGDAKQASDDTEEEREGDFRVDAQRLPNCHAQGTLFWNNLVGASNEYAGDDILEKCVCENPDSKICLYCRLWEIRNTDFLAGVEWLLQRWAKFTVNDDAILDAAEQAWQITEGWANLSHRPRPTTRERLKETIGAALARREAE